MAGHLGRTDTKQGQANSSQLAHAGAHMEQQLLRHVPLSQDGGLVYKAQMGASLLEVGAMHSLLGNCLDSWRIH